MKKGSLKVLIPCLIALAALACLCTYTVSQREFVVLTRFGKPMATIDTAGLHVKRPGLLETVNRIERRAHIFSTKPIQLLLGDKNPIIVTCYVCWRVKDPLLFFQSLLSNDVATQKLSDMVNSQMGNALGAFKLDNIINTDPSQVRLADLEQRILSHANANANRQYGIEVEEIGVRRLAYPEVVTTAVYNRMRSEREKEARKFRAEGNEEATKIRARADREAKEILAKAFKESEILKGEGDHQALEIYAKAYAKDKSFYEFLKAMEVYKDILDQKSTLILSTDSDIFSYLNHLRETPEDE